MEKTYYDYDVADDALEREKQISNKAESKFNQVVFDAKNYLNVRLEQGQNEKSLRIRLLPFPDTRTPFLHIHMHTIAVPKEIAASGWKSYVCLEKTEGLDTEKYGKKCPFCEKAREAFNNMRNETDPQKKENYKTEGKRNLPNEFVVMRCIERGKEDEGVKFLKTKLHQAKDDPYNLIRTLAETRKKEWFDDPENEGKDPRESNILSINEYGYDLTITIKKESKTDSSGKAVEKTSYQVTDVKKPSPLSTDPEKAREWVCDEKKWFEVFVPKPYDYLTIVMDGNIPWYDRETKKWILKEEHDKRKDEEIEKTNEEIRKAEALSTQALTDVPVERPSQPSQGLSDKAPEDDLPF